MLMCPLNSTSVINPKFNYKTLLHCSFFTILLLSICFAASAQQTISGRVTSGDSAVANATVRVKNATAAAQTDNNGTFSITATNGATLIISHVSFVAQEVKVTGNTINIQLQTSAAQSMKEVVVVGYGSQRKSDVTGAVASVDRKRLENLPNTNFAQALQASVPGLSIDQNAGGAEGNNNTIRIRGRNSITAGTSPLIILDGVPYSGSISDINPPDIESITVLKDASSAAIYGSRGANGVIILTTKKGSRGEPVISYDGFYGVQNISNLPRALSAEDFYQYKNTREPGSVTTSEQAVYDSKVFPDWVDMVTRQGRKTQHTLGVNGGSEKFRYYVSGTYLDVKGIAVNDDFKRLSTRINLESKIKKWLTLGTNSQLSHNDRSGLSATFANYQGAFRFNPLTTAFNPDGTPTVYPWPQDLFFPNPLAPTLAENTDETYKIITNNFLQVDIPFIQGLSYRINTGVEYTTRARNTYYGTNTRTGLQAKGDLAIVNSSNKNILVENIVNYNRSFDKHTVGFTGLYSLQNETGRLDSLDATGFPNDVLTFYQANVATSIRPSAGYSKTTLVSQMARINYSYNSKYLLTFTARRDGYSGFGENNKYAFFPSVAAAWNISGEDFMNNSKVISNLKLRASYGSNGNQAVSAYNTLARLSTRSYVDGSTTLPGYIPTSLGNPDLKWETTVGFNAGIDFSLYNGRIEGSLDGYRKNTHDLLLSRQISSVHGVSNVLQNIGKTSNKGLELGINSINVQTSSFVWSTNLSISGNRNRIEDVYGDGKSDTLNQYFIGQPIDVNYSYKYNGVWQLTDDLAKAPAGTKAGFAKVLDVNGDNRITPSADRMIIGSRQPNFIYGVGNSFTYKNFSLYAFIQGVQGTSRVNALISDNVQNGVRNNTFYKNYWTPTNPTNEYYANVLGANVFGADIYESDSYARLKDLSLSYSFSSNILTRLKLTRLKIYANARNLVTVTKWTGLDPELNSQEDIPLQKEFIFGLNISL